MRRFWIFSMLLVFAISCKQDPPIEVDYQYDYLPLSVGSFIEYDVDSTVYDDFDGSVTTYSYIVRETKAESFEDAEGRQAFRVERAKRFLDSVDFSVFESYALLVDGIRAERLRDNLREVVLVFPPQKGVTWDGNTFNPKEVKDFSYSYVAKPETLGTQSLDEVLSVIQVNDTTNFVSKAFSEERYAKGVGLVYKEIIDIETRFELDSGLHLVQIVRDYSK